MLLLSYFRDYRETEESKTNLRCIFLIRQNLFDKFSSPPPVFSFLRISSAGWLLTHPELSVFFAPEDGTTLEEVLFLHSSIFCARKGLPFDANYLPSDMLLWYQHCQSQIIRSRSFADHLAISALSDALGIQIQIFSFCIGDNICTAPSGESNAVAVPLVSIVFTGIHYDILYPIWACWIIGVNCIYCWFRTQLYVKRYRNNNWWGL